MVQALQGPSLEERVARLNELIDAAPESAVKEYQERFDIAWIYHDSALEGVVYSMDELRAAIIRAYTPPPAPRAEPASDSTGTDWTFSGPVPPRRFSSGQLACLARASTAIDCECPHHLAQLVADLTAFEVYSAQCENRGDEDAALHHYLHQVTAQARALIEEALERVARAEGIDY